MFSSISFRLRGLFSKLSSADLVKSAMWVLFATGGQQALRLVGNLVLTRMLFPEAFGVMALVYAVLVTASMLADVGLREGVINSDHVDDPKFMRTAWTLQILRTTLICLVCALAAHPLSVAYEQPQLTLALITIAFGTFLTGFKSIALLAYDKRLEVKTQMIVTLGVQAAGLVFSITWAYFSPSIWALLLGQVLTSALDLIFSYVFFKGHHSRFAWEQKYVLQLFHYGKWIFVSSAISFVVVQGDRLIMGFFMTMDELGKYSIAATWAALIALISGALSGRILHPYFKQAIDNHGTFEKIAKTRNLLNIIHVAGCIFLAFVGEWLIILLYDDRYIEAGWMLQVLALGQVGRTLTNTLQPFVLAQGDSFSQMKYSAASAVILVVLLWVGGELAGAPGIIIGYALSSMVAHPVMAFSARRHGFHCLGVDIGFMVLAIGLCVLGWWLLNPPLVSVIEELFVGLQAG